MDALTKRDQSGGGPYLPNRSNGTATAGSPTRSRRRWRWRLFSGLVAVVVIFDVATLVLFVYSPTDPPRHAEGIWSRSGSDEVAREARAVSLAERGYPRVLLFSRVPPANGTPCPKVP